MQQSMTGLAYAGSSYLNLGCGSFRGFHAPSRCWLHVQESCLRPLSSLHGVGGQIRDSESCPGFGLTARIGLPRREP